MCELARHEQRKKPAEKVVVPATKLAGPSKEQDALSEVQTGAVTASSVITSGETVFNFLDWS